MQRLALMRKEGSSSSDNMDWAAGVCWSMGVMYAAMAMSSMGRIRF